MTTPPCVQSAPQLPVTTVAILDDFDFPSCKCSDTLDRLISITRSSSWMPLFVLETRPDCSTAGEAGRSVRADLLIKHLFNAQ